MGMTRLINLHEYAQVTWVEHAEYDESQVHQLYRPLLSSGMAFGAQRWVATLQRQCECLAILMSSVPSREHSGIYNKIFYTMNELIINYFKTFDSYHNTQKSHIITLY